MNTFIASKPFSAWLPGLKQPFSISVISGIIAILDAVILAGVNFSIYYLYVGWNEEFPAYLAVSFMNIILIIGLFYFFKLYNFERLPQPFHQAKKIFLVFISVFLGLMVIAFALKFSEQISRVWVFSSFAVSFLLVCLTRTGYYYVLLKLAYTKRLTRNLAILGSGEQAQRWIENFKFHHYPWLQIVGIFDDRGERSPDKIGNFPVLGNVDQLVKFARNHRCDDILIALPWTAEERILNILNQLKKLPVHIRLSGDLIATRFSNCRCESFAGMPALGIVEQPIFGWKYVLKIIEDRVLALLILIFISPLLLLIGILIKLDSPGPLFFQQKRYGFQERLIDVIKFRTMYVEKQDALGSQLTLPNDPRVTRIGAFLRKTSLDELPQFINVLRGDMSIVGPRPHAIKASAAGQLYGDVALEYAVRHKVKPGITGWAQINGWRGETDTEEKIIKRVDHDIYYIENWSIGLDLKIIWRTLGVFFKNKNTF